MYSVVGMPWIIPPLKHLPTIQSIYYIIIYQLVYVQVCMYSCFQVIFFPHLIANNPNANAKWDAGSTLYLRSQYSSMEKPDGTTDFRRTAGGYVNSTTFFTELILSRENKGVAKLTLRIAFLSYDSYLFPFDLTGLKFQDIHIWKQSRTSAETTCQGDI